MWCDIGQNHTVIGMPQAAEAEPEFTLRKLPVARDGQV